MLDMTFDLDGGLSKVCNNTSIMSFVRLAYDLMGFRIRKVAMG
jgi:hypothetical protein